MTSRLPDWERRLSDFLARNADRPFAWGSWDCALAATAAAAAITGEDRAAVFRTIGYSTERGARQALRDHGAGTLIRTMNSLYPRKPKAFAQRGDIVMAKGALGICVGPRALFVGEQHLIEALNLPVRTGLIPVDRSAWSRAWAVGHG